MTTYSENESRARKAKSAREAVLDAALHLVSRHGWSGVSVHDVAERAGVSKANVFHHFGSKDALRIALVQRIAGRFGEILQEAETARPGREALEEFALAHADRLFDEPEATQVLISEVLSSDQDRGRFLAQEIFGADFRRLTSFVHEGQRSGSLRRDVDPAVVAVLMIASNVFLFQARSVLRHLAEVSFADDPAAFARTVVRILHEGLRPCEEAAEEDADRS